MEGDALFFHPELDFRRSGGTVAWVGLLVAPGVDTARLEAEVTQRYPELLRINSVFPFEVFLPPGLPPIGGRFPFFLPVRSASSGDQLRRDFIEVPGVVEVLVGFPTQNTSNPRRFDALIGAAMEAAGASG
jgi:hypothetical protein